MSSHADTFSPKLEETKRVGRVLRIMQLISAQPRTWTRAALAREFELSERMVDNDLQLIRHGMRFSLRHAREGYYFDENPIAPVRLTLSEALALALAAQQAKDTGAVDRAIIASAVARLETVLPRSLVPYLQRMGMDDMAFGPAHDRGGTLATIEQALAECRKVRMTYRSASRNNEISERTISPYRLLPYERSWQIAAYDDLRGEVRMFKIDRIITCALVDEQYQIPRDFDLTSYLGSTWGVLRGESGPAEDIVLRFSPLAAPWVRDERWHPSQEMDILSDGGLVMRFHCGITHELVRWILWHGAGVLVECPERLRAMVLTEATQIVELESKAT